MCIQNKLGKILLLVLLPILLSVLASCSGGDKGFSPSLNADDIWDRMADERKKPLPVNRQDDDSGEIFSDLPSATTAGPLVVKDMDAYSAVLRAAGGEYKAIVAILDTPLQEAATEESRLTQLRTKQLHLSRLITLKNNMKQAIKAIDGVDQILADKSHDLLAVMAEYIIRSRSRLDAYN